MSNQEGSRLKSPYRIIRKLGSGSFAEVYEGLDGKTGEHVALKKIKDGVEEDLIELERNNNRRVVKLGRHPNIISFLGEYVDPDTRLPVFVLERAEGGDVYKRLRKMGSFSEADTRDIIRDVLSGLYHLHKNRIIHRDIKPENILLRTKGSPGTAALSDLGLSAQLSSGETVEFNERGTILYCAPEAFTFDLVGRMGDIWPVGIVMHEMLLGRHPFMTQDSSLDNDIFDIKYLELDYNDDEYKHISSDARDLMSKLLRKISTVRPSAHNALQHPWFKTAPKEKNLSVANLDGRRMQDALKLADVIPRVKLLNAKSDIEKQRELNRRLQKRKLAQRLGEEHVDRPVGGGSVSPPQKETQPHLKSARARREERRDILERRRERSGTPRIQRQARPSTEECKVHHDSSDNRRISDRDRHSHLNC